MVKESTETFIENNFDVGMKIHSICYDKSVSKLNTKLFTYMFFKMQDSGLGLDYFDSDHTVEIDALMMIIGANSGTIDAFVIDSEPAISDVPVIVGELAARAIKQIEIVAQRRYGIESPITPELLSRLKFHTDNSFRKVMVDEFTNIVLSSMGSYTIDNVTDSISRERAQINEQDAMLKKMFS